MSDYHFGYGSNLDLGDWKKWCDDHNRKSSEMQVEPGIFFLPDYELEFHYYSGSRRGGALDVVKLRGHAVAGKLFKVTGDGWGSLDAKEGAPSYYERKQVEVLSDFFNTCFLRIIIKLDISQPFFEFCDVFLYHFKIFTNNK